jgi:hypothetical protein
MSSNITTLRLQASLIVNFKSTNKGGRLVRPSIAEQINAYISRGRPDAYCDACIADGLAIIEIQHVQMITSALATTDRFNRSVGACEICGCITFVTAKC